jgi:hypothetical protein
MINDDSYLASTSDAPMNLKEARDSPDWLEWEKAIRIELEQLQAMRTWKLVEKPPDVIPIANKWVREQRSYTRVTMLDSRA